MYRELFSGSIGLTGLECNNSDMSSIKLLPSKYSWDGPYEEIIGGGGGIGHYYNSIVLSVSMDHQGEFIKGDTVMGDQGSFFGKVGQSLFLCEIWHHHALYGHNCPINESLTPMGSKISLFLRSEQPFPRYSWF